MRYQRGRLVAASFVTGIMPISGRHLTYPDGSDSPSQLCQSFLRGDLFEELTPGAICR